MNRSYLTCILLLCSFSSAYQLADTNILLNQDKLSNVSWNKVIENTSTLTQYDVSTWFHEIPFPALAIATSKTFPPGECRKQLQRYLKDLYDGKLWAVRMYDSSTKLQSGILEGHVSDFGDFDECYNIDVKLPNYDDNMEIQGKYCLVDLKYSKKEQYKPFVGRYELDFDPNGSVWEAIEEKGDFRRLKRYALQLAICIPAVCRLQDIQTALTEYYNEFGKQNNLTIKASVDSRKCQTFREEPTFSRNALVFTSVIVVIIGLVIAASVYDEVLNTRVEKTKATELLLCFSVRRNLQTLVQANYKHRGFDSIHMLRFFFTCIVLVGHRSMVFAFTSQHNTRFLEEVFTKRFFTISVHGALVVDGFFAISGLLTSYGLLEHLNKTKQINFLTNIIIRFIRFTPVYAFAVFFYATVFPYFGSGPVWKSRIRLESSYCANHWWKNLFYLNNYLNNDEMCLFQSWYLTVSFQGFILIQIFVYIFWKLPRKLGYIFLGLLLFTSAMIVSYITYVNRIEPMFFPVLNVGSPMDHKFFVNYHMKLHMSLTSYLVGVFCGALLFDLDAIKWRISKVWSNILFLVLVVGMSLISQNLGFKYYDPNTKASPLDNALYAAFHRGVFGASFGAYVILLQVGEGLNFHYNFVTPRWVQPLSRITYCVYLTHHFIQLYQIGTARHAKLFNMHNTFWDFIPDVFYSFLAAFVVHLCIESPFRKMEKVFLSSKPMISSDVGLKDPSRKETGKTK